MDFLKRELAPVVDAAWEKIEEHAARVLRANLSARHAVDFKGPKGLDFSAVNLGRLSHPDERLDDGVRYGIRQVQPMVEVCVPFELDIPDLDDMARGAGDIASETVTAAAHKLARFEERAIYLGFAPAQIAGLAQASQHTALPLGGEATAYPDAVARAIMALTDAGVGGPYAFILGPRPFRLLAADVAPYSARQRIARLIEGPILLSPVLNGGFLIALRGGDFELHVGLDASVGYHHHTERTVSLYLAETFTFRVLGPEAVIRLEIAG